MLAIVGDIHSAAIGKGYGLLHEVRNYRRDLNLLTPWAVAGTAALDVFRAEPVAQVARHAHQRGRVVDRVHDHRSHGDLLRSPGNPLERISDEPTEPIAKRA